MHPPTPYPASARSKSKLQNVARDTAFREITARANAVSKSEQDFLSVMKKTEEQATEKRTSKTPTVRRYSVASKFAGPKTENANVVLSGLEAKPKTNKRASLQGVVSGNQFNCASTQVTLASRKSTAVSSSRLSSKGTTVPSMQTSNLGDPPKRQSLASEQGIELHKPPSDLHKRSASAYAKVESANTIKARRTLLSSACYWLEQVKLAEAMEKHGVSIGFFRLAVECEAEPVNLLTEELIAYIKRYSLWSSTIQQVLLCYGVTDEAQDTLFSQLAATGISETSSPCTPAKNIEGIYSSDKDPANQVSEKHLKTSDGGFDCATAKDTVDVKEEDLHPEKVPVSDATGLIESMDAESLTRVVVSYIMSSLNHPDSSKNLKNDASRPEDNSTLACYVPDNHDSSALLVAEHSLVSVQESMSIPNSVDTEAAMSTGSLPSLNIWNTLSKEVDTGGSDAQQEEVPIILDNDVNDSYSTAKVSGEEMCVSMELDVDDTMSDNLSDLASKSPTCEDASSEERKCHAAQVAGETHGVVAIASGPNRGGDEATSEGEKHEILLETSIYNKSQEDASEIVQGFDKFESKSRKGQKIKSLPTKTETEKRTASQMIGVPASQGNRSSSSTYAGRHQNGKERSASTSDRKETESAAPNKDNATALAALTARRISISTPRSSTSAHTPNVEPGSRTRSKSRISQSTVLGTETNHMHLKSEVPKSKGILGIPNQDRAVESKNASKQVSLNYEEGMDARTTDGVGLMTTPGSAGVRRSARLIKPSEGNTVSTPGSVSTPSLQRRLGTPMKAEK